VLGLNVDAFLNLSELETLDTIELCDILWLSKYMKTDKKYYKENTNTEATNKKTQSKHKKEVPPLESTKETTKTQPSSIEIEENKDIGLSASTDHNFGKSSYFVLHKGYFENSNKLSYYLRGFNKKVASKRKRILNEVKTVDYIANTHVTKVFFQPKKVKKYELYLTIDIGNSMKPWEEMIITYSQLLVNSGTFRSVKKIYIDTDSKKCVFYRDKNKLNNFSLKEIGNLSNNKLFFVLSDMESKAWREGDAFETFFDLFKKVSLFMVQMLPYRLWKSTALDRASLTKLKTKEDYSLNGNYISELDGMLNRLDNTSSRYIKLPIALFELESLKVIGNTLQNKHDNTIDGAIINLNHIMKGKKKQKIDVLVEIDNFFVNASREAQKLMVSFAAVPLNIPIMRMIQEKVIKDTKNIYLAEVLNSKLLIKEGNFFKFINDEVHDEIFKMLGRESALEIAYSNSDYIQENLNAKFGFKALLAGEVDLDNIDFSKNEKIFASISCKILKSLGAEYAKKSGCKGAEKIEAIIPQSKRFKMGSNDGGDDEKPIHEVVINYDFEIGKYPVTFEEYDLFCEDRNREKPDDEGWGRGKRPVINVSWEDAKEYCEWLNKKLSLDENTGYYRLPTEAEWEYSCHAGTTAKWSFGDDEKELTKYAWYDENSSGKTHPVGEKLPNPWGSYDMHGNVWEWCEDDFADNYHDTLRDGIAHVDKKANAKVLRGGTWYSDASFSHSCNRHKNHRIVHYDGCGFRLLRTLDSDLGDFKIVDAKEEQAIEEIEPIGDVTFKCKNCQTKYALNCDELEWEVVASDERQMGAEVNHEAYYKIGCEKCDNDMSLTFNCWEYPVGAENYRDVQSEGVEDINGDCCVDFHKEDRLEYEKEAIEEIKQWFFEHYEDPANSLPYISKEGGYQWVHGGPTDTADEINNQFLGQYNEEILEKAIDIIGRYEEWSPIPQSEDEFQDALGKWAKKKADEDES